MRIWDFLRKQKESVEYGKLGINDVDALLAALKDNRASVRNKTIRRLGEIFADRPGSPLDPLFAAWSDPTTREAAANALDDIVGPGVFGLLVSLECDRSNSLGMVRPILERIIDRMTEAFYGLDRYERAVELLLIALRYPEFCTGANRALELLTDSLLARGAAIYQNESVIIRLFNTLQGNSPYVKTNALIILKKILTPYVDVPAAAWARQAVGDALKDEDPYVRISAIHTFAAIMPRDAAVDRIREIGESDCDLKVRAACTETLVTLR